MDAIPIEAYAIPIAHAIANGHVSCGLRAYDEFLALQAQPRRDAPDQLFNSISMAAAAATNLALALELLLKIHWCQYSGSYPRGHDIAELGNLFTDDRLLRLEHLYVSTRDKPEPRRFVNFDLQASGPGIPPHAPAAKPNLNPTAFKDAISIVGRGYERWRYFYEYFSAGSMAAINFGALFILIDTMQGAIRNHKGLVKIELGNHESPAKM